MKKPVNQKEVFSLLDLTNLNENCSEHDIKKLCAKVHYHDRYVAAVCIYPRFVGLAKELLADTPVAIATVCNFPEGTDEPERVLQRIEKSIDAGATEIDMVMPYQAYMTGDDKTPFQLIQQAKQVCNDKALLKVNFRNRRSTRCEVNLPC